MAKHFDKAITEFLAEKGNLSLAFEIGHYASHLRQELSNAFWDSIQERIISVSRITTANWKIERLRWEQKDPVVSEAGYKGLNALQEDFAAQSQVLGFAIEEERFQDYHNIYVGLRWKLPVLLKDDHYSKGPLMELRSDMLRAGYESWPPQWVCGRYVHQYPSPDAFFTTYSDDSKPIVDAVQKQFQTLVVDYGQRVTEINRLLQEEQTRPP